jgi:hypothetical protein
MKYILMALLLCSGNLMAQTEKLATDLTTDGPQCPPGLCPVVSFNLEVLNFHKPRTSCSKGFGFCIRFSTAVNCEYCRWKSGIENGVVNSTISLSGQIAEWHLPLSLKNEKSFEDTDMSFFEIDDDSFSIDMGNGHRSFVKGGTYPVVTIDNEMVVYLKLN